jgi:hypothetical protein
MHIYIHICNWYIYFLMCLYKFRTDTWWSDTLLLAAIRRQVERSGASLQSSGSARMLWFRLDYFAAALLLKKPISWVCVGVLLLVLVVMYQWYMKMSVWDYYYYYYYYTSNSMSTTAPTGSEDDFYSPSKINCFFSRIHVKIG